MERRTLTSTSYHIISEDELAWHHIVDCEIVLKDIHADPAATSGQYCDALAGVYAARVAYRLITGSTSGLHIMDLGAARR